MKVLVSGGGGQLACELQRTCPADVTLESMPIEALDVTDAGKVEGTLKRIKPDAVINTAAYTAVDAAESDEITARSVNRCGAEHLARTCGEIDARFIQISTDFVFDGDSTVAWRPEDRVNPLSVYGRTKLEGEQAVNDILGGDALIVRTAWLYGAHGSNFVKTMLKLMRERGAVRVVDDQVGTPTWANSLGVALWCMLEKGLRGVHHWTDDGQASWHDFALAIATMGSEIGMLEKMPDVEPVPGSEFPTPARRPAFSVLDCTQTRAALAGTDCIPCVHWRENLATMMWELHSA